MKFFPAIYLLCGAVLIGTGVFVCLDGRWPRWIWIPYVVLGAVMTAHGAYRLLDWQ